MKNLMTTSQNMVRKYKALPRCNGQEKKSHDNVRTIAEQEAYVVPRFQGNHIFTAVTGQKPIQH
jgi:hypothetical protein